MGLRVNLQASEADGVQHDSYLVRCDVCRTESSAAARDEVETVAFNEGFIDLPDGRWICDLVDPAHDALARLV